MGTAMVLGCLALALLFVSGVRLGPVMKVMAVLAALALIVAVASPYRRARLLSFLDPTSHSSSSGYQVVQSLIGLGSGHLFGMGIGGGQAQWGYLPNAHTDFIFSVIGEQLGIVGALFVLGLLAGFIWLGIRAAMQSPDRFGALLALGLVAWVAAETLINVGAVVGVLPVTGIPLPFISFGGSSLVITMAAAGLLINVARQGESGVPPLRRRRVHPTSVTARRGTVIAGGGTGGHVVPSLQIARAMVARGHAASTIELYGSRRGHEAATWPALEFPYTLLPGRGIRRSLRPAALVANVGAVLGLAWACVRAIGSFLAAPAPGRGRRRGLRELPGRLRRRRDPCAARLRDDRRRPGRRQRPARAFRGRQRRGLPGTDLPRAHVTGTPVAPEMAALDRSPGGPARARAALGLPADRRTIAAVSGSLGARRVNRAVAEVAEMWRGCDALGLYHVTGRRDYEAFAGGAHVTGRAHGATRRRTGEEKAGAGDRLVYRVVPFEDHMPDLYTAADVCVTRAGAMTSAELLIAGVPAILVPLPGAPRDHQTRNAEALVRMGVAVHVPDPECDGARLARELEALLSEPERLRAMREAARGHAHPDAAARVAELVDAHAR